MSRKNPSLWQIEDDEGVIYDVDKDSFEVTGFVDPRFVRVNAETLFNDIRAYLEAMEQEFMKNPENLKRLLEDADNLHFCIQVYKLFKKEDPK